MRQDARETIATVAYADIFDYPLTKGEVGLWKIGSAKAISVKALRQVKAGSTTYTVLPGRQGIIARRRKRTGWATGKWLEARHAASHYLWIPTVLLVGVTGGLAMDNAKKEDDIDLFFIVRRGTLWVTRLIVTIVSEWHGIRRHPGEEEVADKVCLNMFMTEDALLLPEAEQDLFAAHEVLQMTPLWSRGGVYRSFLRANAWVKSYLPHAWKVREKQHEVHTDENHAGVVAWYRMAEPLLRFMQRRYMERHRTTEVVTDTVLRFHPRDARRWIRKKLATRLEKFDIPLDSIFFCR